MPNYSEKVEKLKDLIEMADAIVIGAGAGLSTAAGYTYDGERFYENFGDFAEAYGLADMYSAGFYPYSTPEEFWGFWSRNIDLNRYQNEETIPVYSDLYELVKDKNYFVITTNVDHLFQKSGFDKERLFYTQGDYGLFQCSVPCSNETYDNETIVKKMVRDQEDRKIPTHLIPHCPRCGAPMTMNLRADDKFVQDEGWHKALERYQNFINENIEKNILFLDLGIGGNTPGIIKYPFWQMTREYPNAKYACVNLGEAIAPPDIRSRSICIDADIADVVRDLD